MRRHIPSFLTRALAGLSLLLPGLLLPGSAQAGPRTEVSLAEETPGTQAAQDAQDAQDPNGRSVSAPAGGPRYSVRRGDTLGAIAQRQGVSIEQLCQWNAGLNPDRIREGQKLWVGPAGREVAHEVQPGEYLSQIARRYEVKISQLLRWNRGLRRDHVRAGRTLTVYTQVPLSRSKSVGTPNRGRLVDGTRLPEHPAYVIRTRDRAWGTEEAVHSIISAFDAVRSRFPRAPKLKVHDLSLSDGGPMHHHRSHQSGRDVDIAYFQDACKGGVCGFRPVGPGTIDARRNWALLRHWLDHEQLEAVFIDYKLQRVLYREARRQGASKAELSRWFQYPRGRTHPSGVVRHFPKHHDHMHVRFTCHGSDPDCKTLRPVLTGAQHASK